MPCVSTVVPWEAWYFGRQTNPAAPVPFKWTFHFSFGVAQFASAYTHLWPQVPTNKVVGVMWPERRGRQRNPRRSRAPAQEGRLHDRRPGRLRGRHNRLHHPDLSFQEHELRDLQHVPDPAGLRHVLGAGRAAGIQAEDRADRQDRSLPVAGRSRSGSIGNGLASGVYWAPTWPYSSSLTGISSANLASGYEASSGKEWNQQAGASLALFDVAAAALKASGNPKDKLAVATAMKSAGGGHAARSSRLGTPGRIPTSSRHRSSADSGLRLREPPIRSTS